MITPSFSLTATERVLPKLALDFTTASLDSRITFTRTTDATHPATYVNSSGYIAASSNNAPRFDYDPVTLVCNGLLIEESRSNTVPVSEDFTAWSTNNATCSNASGTSPANTNTANKVISTTSSGSNVAFIQNTGSVAADSNYYTFSCYVKQGTSPTTTVYLSLYNGTFQEALTTITWADKSIVVSGTASTTSTRSGIAKNAGNGWYRVTITFQNNGTNTGVAYRLYSRDTGSTHVVGEYSYVWGAQLEVGAFPTSYIPTTSASLTRNADVATMTGTNFSSWYNQTQGSLEVQYNQYAIIPGNKFIAVISSATNANQAGFLTDNTPRAYWWIDSGGVNQAAINAGNMTLNATNKQTGGYLVNNFGMSVNGAATVTDTSGSVPVSPDRMFIGTSAGGLQWSGWIQKINYWPQRLTNNEIQAFSK